MPWKDSVANQDRLGSKPASATMVLDGLETADHLRRERDTKDRRRVVVHTTKHARQELRGALGTMI